MSTGNHAHTHQNDSSWRNTSLGTFIETANLACNRIRAASRKPVAFSADAARIAGMDNRGVRNSAGNARRLSQRRFTKEPTASEILSFKPPVESAPTNEA